MLFTTLRTSLLRQAVPRCLAAANKGGAIRRLNVQEYVTMEHMRAHGIRTPICYTASTPLEAAAIFDKVNPPKNRADDCAAIIKAQVLSGGRGKGSFTNAFKGGVKFLTNAGQAAHVANQMLGSRLITKQTGAQGLPCYRVLLRECFDIEQELYLSIILDRLSGGPLLVASPCGGTSIEDVATTTPEQIFTHPIDMETGVTDEQCYAVASNLGLEPDCQAHEQCQQLVRNLYEFFMETDSLQVEINPLAQTTEGKLVVADAKWVVDDKARDRQSHIFAQRDFSQEDPREVIADKYGFGYVGLDGNVGCVVNGAGLSMANMDLLALKGASPACFLDLGGAANQAAIDGAFELLQNDDQVRVIFVNIFGGIVRCYLIAQGLVRASGNVTKPIVVRLEGNQASVGLVLLEAAKILNFSNLLEPGGRQGCSDCKGTRSS